MRTIKQTPWIWEQLQREAELDLASDYARKREPGHWSLILAAYVTSGHNTLSRWWCQTDDALWREAGFAKRPPYRTVWERFREMEHAAGAFTSAGGRAIQHARRHEPRIGAHVHVDSTESETHAALVHDCRSGEGCPHESSPDRRRSARRPRRQSTDAARTIRQVRACKRIRVGNHWYRTTDPTAGVRAYLGPRGARVFWHGFYNQKAIDHLTGAPLVASTETASRNEHHIYPALLDTLEENLGGRPETVIADAGFTVASVYELNTRRGIATLAPHRSNGTPRHDHDEFDRHGVPRCRHCGGPSVFRRFFFTREQPRLAFRCLVGSEAGCARDQTISCSRGWKHLLPLWRIEPLYHELRESHRRYERVHHHWRDRYNVAGDSVGNRPRIAGVGWQHLIAQVALLVEWVRVIHKHGWWAGRAARRAGSQAERVTSDQPRPAGSPTPRGLPHAQGHQSAVRPDRRAKRSTAAAPAVTTGRGPAARHAAAGRRRARHDD